MDFSVKYTSVAVSEKDKIVLSNDVYALCEMLEELTANIKRLSNLTK